VITTYLSEVLLIKKHEAISKDPYYYFYLEQIVTNSIKVIQEWRLILGPVSRTTQGTLPYSGGTITYPRVPRVVLQTGHCFYPRAQLEEGWESENLIFDSRHLWTNPHIYKYSEIERKKAQVCWFLIKHLSSYQ